MSASNTSPADTAALTHHREMVQVQAPDGYSFDVMTKDLRCPNPYCDAHGWVACDATGTANAYATPACKVGPHPATTTQDRPAGDR